MIMFPSINILFNVKNVRCVSEFIVDGVVLRAKAL